MKILALNATYRSEGATTALTRKALEGAASVGAETEMVMLKDCDIQYCRNCLACYRNLEAEIAPCPIADGMTSLLEKIRDADGVIFSSPIHCGFISALMTAFFERAVWRLCKPTMMLAGLGGIPAPRLSDRARPVATIVNAGGMPRKFRMFCDTATPWLKEQGALICNGMAVGDMYASAVFTKKPEGEDWQNLYFLRKLTSQQLQEAHDLGRRVAETIKSGQAKPYVMAIPGGKAAEVVGGIIAGITGLIETTGE